MTETRMHRDEVLLDATAVRGLLQAQFPAWAELPLRPVPSAGTDNALFRLGEELVVRLPRLESTAGQVEKEQRWLPVLAPRLPLAIPVPLAMGEPADGFPWRWSIYRWIEGETVTPGTLSSMRDAATVLAEFVTSLQQTETTDGPRPGAHNSFRGVPLAPRDAATRRAIAQLEGMTDTGAATAAWEAALAEAAWDGPPVWLHGDLSGLNLLARDGSLSAVIDFGCLGVGDPACDLLPAWTLLDADSREVFRAALGVDDGTWARGRGWALSVSEIQVPYYLRTNPVLAALGRHTIEAVLGERRSGR